MDEQMDVQMGTDWWQTWQIDHFDFSAVFPFGLWVKTLCGEMHFSVPQLANYWLQLQIQPNVLSISGCDTERKAEREQTFFALFSNPWTSTVF